MLKNIIQQEIEGVIQSRERKNGKYIYNTKKETNDKKLIKHITVIVKTP